MQSVLTREQVVTIAAVKWIRDEVLSYRGPPEKLKQWLLGKLDDMNRTADEILAASFSP